jgi:hypothetical protein
MSALRAAAGSVDLQPVVGSRLTGFAARLEPSVGILDPLNAKLLLLDDGVERLLWIACDLIGFAPQDDAELRQLAGERLGIAPERVLVSCTHTHSGPCSMPFRGPLREVDRAWLSRMFEAIAREGGALDARLQPARLAHAGETVTGIGFNRQDGVSPIDERLLVAQLRGDDGRAIATLLNYATHPVVLGDQNLMFSADFTGYATRFVEDAVGGVAMFIQGSAGDVNPFIFRDHPREAGTFEVAEEMGRELADAAVRAIGAMRFQSNLSLAADSSQIELPLDPPPPTDELAALKTRLIAQCGSTRSEGRWAMFELAWIDELEAALARGAVPRSLAVRLFAARIGDLYVVTFPLEIYSQIGIDVRRLLAPRAVIIAGYTNGLLGYAPTDRAKQQGGYGPASSYRFFPDLLTPLGSGTDARLVAAAAGLLSSVDR